MELTEEERKKYKQTVEKRNSLNPIVQDMVSTRKVKTEQAEEIAKTYGHSSLQGIIPKLQEELDEVIVQMKEKSAIMEAEIIEISAKKVEVDNILVG